MRIVAHEDRSAPIVAVHLMYHVGSRHEEPGRTGLAHLLEHLLFEGTEHSPKGEFDRLLESAGATNNGSTWLDRTNYYETVPTHAVELALWLERERMAHFLPVLEDTMLELQRGVVMNERLQSYDNRPYGLADERLHELLFPAAHPYSWPTIGYMPDLEAITRADVERFYSTFYTPRNTVLVLAGDIGADHAFELAEHFFGDLPGGPVLPPRIGPGRGTLDGRRSVLPDQVSFDRVYRAHAVPSYGSREWVALDVLAYLLADGESSRLTRALLRDRQLAQDVDTYLYPTELNGIFGIVATARSGVDAEQIEDAIRDSLLEIATDEVSPDEVRAAVRRVRRDQLAELELVEERAELLAYAATVLGEAEALETVLDAYATITPEEIREAATRYLSTETAATVVVSPDEGDEHA